MKVNEFDFPVVIREKEKMFHLWIPELGLFAEGSDLPAAYQNLAAQKKEYLGRIEALGLSSVLRERFSTPSSAKSSKKLFFATVGLLVFLFLFIGASISMNLGRLSVRLKEAVNAPPEKQREYLENYHQFLIRIKPYWDETRSTLTSEENKSGS